MATTDGGSAATETTPLIPPSLEPSRPPRPARSVTFNANPVSKTIDPDPNYRHRSSQQQNHHHHVPQPPLSPSAISTGGLGGGPPVLAALNTKLRRRNSGSGPAGLSPGNPLDATLPVRTPNHGLPLPKVGPQRSTKNVQKLKLLPTPEPDPAEAEVPLLLDGEDDVPGDVYSQYARIKDPTARRDAARLGKADRDRLPRVTAYCTANTYQMDSLMRFLKGRGKTRGAAPKLIDECIYTPYSYGAATKSKSAVTDEAATVRSTQERRHSTGEVGYHGHRPPPPQDLINLANDGTSELNSIQPGTGNPTGSGGPRPSQSAVDLSMGDESALLGDDMADFDIHVHTPEVFLFDYGVVVIWGMSAAHEQRFLKELAKFETEKLAPDDVETEKFNFYYTHEYQARIYNDFIALRDKRHYMTKLAISHALAQSVKTSLFEELIASTIDRCKDIPAQLAVTGKIALSRSGINMQIGELFILRISIHLNGSVLDTPELFWVEPHLEPVYQAVRSYLEMDQRVGLLTERLDVIADLLAVLKEQLSHGHGEKLEWIVIILIAAEILVALVNIVVDLYVT